jgi:hypothetical protein
MTFSDNEHLLYQTCKSFFILFINSPLQTTDFVKESPRHSGVNSALYLNDWWAFEVGVNRSKLMPVFSEQLYRKPG